MFGLGWQEILLILLLALLLFGAKRVPGIAKSLGKSIQEFKKGMDPNAKDDEESEDGKLLEKKEEAGKDLSGSEQQKSDSVKKETKSEAKLQ